MSQLFASGGESIGVSASTSVLPMTWFRVYLKKKKKIASRKNSSNEAINILVITGYFLYSGIPKILLVNSGTTMTLYSMPL